MARFKEYHLYDGLGIAELVKKREVSPIDIYNEALHRYQITHSELNAVTIPFVEAAKKHAEGIKPTNESPVFCGVPFLVKNLTTEIKDTTMTSGCAALIGTTCTKTSALAQRYLDTGVTVMGRSNTSELGLLGITEPEIDGPTRNPWNTLFGVGGSSGGSAAAVAARIVPIAGGNDVGGSLRIPAAHCGLLGLKPSRGRVVSLPASESLWDGAATEHVLTLSVRDSAAMLDQISGIAEGGTTHQKRSYRKIIESPVRQLRIGFCYHSPFDTAVDFECISATQQAAKLLAQQGHIVEEVQFPVAGHPLAQAFFMLYFGQVAAQLTRISNNTKTPISKLQIEEFTYMCGLMGRKISAGTYVSMKQDWYRMAQEMQQFHLKYDVLLTPTLGQAPAEIGNLQPKFLHLKCCSWLAQLGLADLVFTKTIMNKMSAAGFTPFPFTQVANLTGQPAISVPLSWTGSGLPCGVQFIAPIGDEATLLQIATQLEEIAPWFDKMPSLVKKYH